MGAGDIARMTRGDNLASALLMTKREFTESTESYTGTAPGWIRGR